MTSSSLICAPVDCHRPVIPYATAACSDGTTYGSECIFKCDKPAKMVGKCLDQFHESWEQSSINTFKLKNIKRDILQ